MDPLDDDYSPALELAHQFAARHVAGLDDFRAASEAMPQPTLPLPEAGIGATAALDRFLVRHGNQLSGSPGPRYWGFVNGGVTPAALAGDWLASAIDQNSQLNGDGAAALIEGEAIAMLRALFGLTDQFNGVFVTGGTMANFTALGIALQRLGAARGVDFSRSGLAALGPVRILSGSSHSSIAKSAAMLGIGRDSLVEVPTLAGREAVDPIALAEAAQTHADAALIIVANAGTVLTGDFDSIDELADIAERANAHLHVDGAFGAFAACSRRHRNLLSGMNRADTVASDGHKFLNVPFDSGFVFARSLAEQVELFKNVSSYQAAPRVDPLHLIHLTPQNSRRLRALPAWLTLQAYGSAGYQAIVERCCGLAEKLARELDSTPGFRTLAPVRFDVVCFQIVRGDRPANAEENDAFLRHIRDDGRVFVTPGLFGGEPCVRLALVNWRTRPKDIDIALQAFVECRAQTFANAGQFSL